MRLIDADKLKDIISDTWILDRIDEQPTVGPVKHGRWVAKPFLGSDAKIFVCEACNKPVWWVSDYCPNCGARMEK